MSANRKVLIITYYWPPGGGSGVQRWLKFTKYLRALGWEPIIYTPENPEMAAFDASLAKDIPDGLTVLRTPIREPYSIYKRLTGRKKSDSIGAGFVSESSKPGFTERIARWIRGNLFIPDARRWWIRPSVNYLKTWLSKNPVDAIISTGPPHSMHLIALALKQQTGLPWLADFRDPWTNIDFYNELLLSRWADRKHHVLEASVVSTADLVTVVSPTMAEEFRLDHNREIVTLTNGYDDDDFRDIEALPRNDSSFSIAHIGTMTPTRNPIGLWRALSKMQSTGIVNQGSLQIRLIGRIDHSIREAISDHQLDASTDFIPYVPHDEVVAWQQGASVLLLLLNQSKNAKGILPGKFFEYMASGRPILCLGPIDSDAAKIIEITGTGRCFEYDDVDNIETWLTSIYNNESDLVRDQQAISSYSRLNLTRQLDALLRGLIDKSS